MPTVKLILFGAGQTKKNRPQLFGKGTGPIIIPSQDYLDWLDLQLEEKALLKQDLGDAIPLRGPVSLYMTVFRKQDAGDLFGFADAVADAIQSDSWQCQRLTYRTVIKFQKNKKTSVKLPVESKEFDCHKKFVGDEAVLVCPVCGFLKMKRSRKGLGIIVDDKQIVESHLKLDIDRQNPRIELSIVTIDVPQQQLSLIADYEGVPGVNTK